MASLKKLHKHILVIDTLTGMFYIKIKNKSLLIEYFIFSAYELFARVQLVND
jgi:hypothetical protein